MNSLIRALHKLDTTAPHINQALHWGSVFIVIKASFFVPLYYLLFPQPASIAASTRCYGTRKFWGEKTRQPLSLRLVTITHNYCATTGSPDAICETRSFTDLNLPPLGLCYKCYFSNRVNNHSTMQIPSKNAG